MKRILVFLTIIISAFSAYATGPAPDILVWKGDTLQVFSNPLELRSDIDSLRPKLFGIEEAGVNTACWRGYIAEWKIVAKELYLTNILSCEYFQDSIKADLETVFPSEFESGLVKATWVTGTFLIPKGKLIHYVHSGYDSFYETELVLTFDHGRLVDQRTYDNSKSHKSVYLQYPDSLASFIYRNIDWSIISKLDTGKIKVFVQLQSGKTSQPDSVKIMLGTKNQRVDQEITRVINNLPDWDVYYRLGEVYPMKWAVPIILDEKRRKKYSSE